VIATQTGFAHSTISQYFNGQVLPPPERLYAIAGLLEADEEETRAFAALRDDLDARRRLGIDVSAPDDDLTAARDLSPEFAASRLLRDLLETEPYRSRWKPLVRPPDGPDEAIALYIARHLNSTSEVVQEPDEFRRRIARALAQNRHAVVLSSATLAWFVEAFDMSADDARHLRHLHAGSPAIRYVRGVPGETKLPLLQAVSVPYRTLDLREYHYLGPDGLPYKHRTDRVIRAEADGYRTFIYLVDTAMLTLEVEAGGTPGPLYRVRTNSGAVLHASNIDLESPLDEGETAVLNYSLTLQYREPPPPEMRYAFRNRVDKFLLSVQFHPDRLPSRLWWAEWDGISDAAITHREPVQLNNSGGAHRFLDGGVERAVIGFVWEW
jgi:transcriptional regulator with XRE-family HTH domain